MQRKQNNTYRKKPLAVFENGTRIYAPTASESRYRVVAPTIDGRRGQPVRVLWQIGAAIHRYAAQPLPREDHGGDLVIVVGECECMTGTDLASFVTAPTTASDCNSGTPDTPAGSSIAAESAASRSQITSRQ
jgi:hypothetical protein